MNCCDEHRSRTSADELLNIQVVLVLQVADPVGVQQNLLTVCCPSSSSGRDDEAGVLQPEAAARHRLLLPEALRREFNQPGLDQNLLPAEAGFNQNHQTDQCLT